jgi:hypothetical protein
VNRPAGAGLFALAGLRRFDELGVGDRENWGRNDGLGLGLLGLLEFSVAASMLSHGIPFGWGREHEAFATGGL